jgi:hypothetical protein
VLLLSDQQIVTGIAILWNAYAQIDSNFSVYHWQITVWLAWFCSVSHLSTLSVLRHHLRSHPALRVIRLILMLAIAITLVLALLPTGSPGWLQSPGQPAGCYSRFLTLSWNTLPGQNSAGNAQFLAITTVAILANAYTTRFIKLYQWSSASARKFLRVRPGNLLKRGLRLLLEMTRIVGPKWSPWAVCLIYLPCLTGFFIARVVCDLAESMLWEVCAPISPPWTYPP